MNQRIPNRHLVLPRFIAAIVLLGAALALSAAGALAAAAPASVTIGVASTSLGQVLTGPSGHTLYTLSSDPTNKSSCAGACITPWPPLLVAAGGSVSAASGATGTFATFARSDGTTQVSDNGRPLYSFFHDTAAGQTNGEGVSAFGGTWHVAKPAATAGGTPPATDTAPNQPTTSSGSVPLLLFGLLTIGVALLLTRLLPRRDQRR